MMQKDTRTTDVFGRTIKKSFDPEQEERLKTRRKAYDKFFAGYTVREVSVPGRQGTKVVRIYTGELYHEELTRNQSVWLRVALAILGAVAAALFLGALILNVASNRCWYVMLFSSLAAVFYVRQFFSLHTFLWSGPNLKIFEYSHGVKELLKRGNQTLFILAVPIAAVLVMFLTQQGSFHVLELLRLAMVIASGVIMQQIGKIGSKIEYTVIPAKEE